MSKFYCNEAQLSAIAPEFNPSLPNQCVLIELNAALSYRGDKGLVEVLKCYQAYSAHVQALSGTDAYLLELTNLLAHETSPLNLVDLSCIGGGNILPIENLKLFHRRMFTW